MAFSRSFIKNDLDGSRVKDPAQEPSNSILKVWGLDLVTF